MTKRLPLKCPSCEHQLVVKQLYCESCETEVVGVYALPIISRLSSEEQKFIFDFVLASGSLKVMAQNLKLSYPSVRNILDDIIGKLNKLEENEK